MRPSGDLGVVLATLRKRAAVNAATPPASPTDNNVGPISNQEANSQTTQTTPDIKFDIPIPSQPMNKSAFAYLGKKADVSPSGYNFSSNVSAPNESQSPGVFDNLKRSLSGAGQVLGAGVDTATRQAFAPALERFSRGIQFFPSEEAQRASMQSGENMRAYNKGQLRQSANEYDQGMKSIREGLLGAGNAAASSMGLSAPTASPAAQPSAAPTGAFTQAAPAAPANNNLGPFNPENFAQGPPKPTFQQSLPLQPAATPNPPATPTLQTAPSPTAKPAGNLGPVSGGTAPQGGIQGLFKTPMTSPGLAPSPAAAPAARPAAPAAGTDWNAAFHKDTGTAFNPNPNSAMDQENMRRLQAQHATLNRKQYRGLNKTAFASLEKEATAGKAIGAGLRGIGKLLSRIGEQAKIRAELKAFNTPRASGTSPQVYRQAFERAFERANAVGGKRMSAGQSLKNVGKELAEGETGLAKAVNYGVPLAGVAGAAGIGHHMGYGSGREAGVRTGYDAGAENAIQAAQNAGAGQGGGGYLGNLWEALKGNAPQGGFNPGLAYGELANSRDAAIQNILNS
jgi:hypothetical protein